MFFRYTSGVNLLVLSTLELIPVYAAASEDNLPPAHEKRLRAGEAVAVIMGVPKSWMMSDDYWVVLKNEEE